MGSNPTPSDDRTRLRTIIAYGVGVLAAVAIIAAVSEPWMYPQLDIFAYVLFCLSASGGIILLWNRDDKAAIAVLIGVAVAARSLLFFKAPFLSDDAYRYLWDGRMLLHHIDPYVYAPDAAVLQSWHSSWLYPYIYWHQWPSLYPPLDLGLFALADWLNDRSLLAIKTLVELGDLAAMALLIVCLRARGLPAGRAALYAWAPLCVLEFSWSAHEEAWCAAALVGAVLLLERRRIPAAGAALGAAVLVKLFPLGLLPVLFPRRALAGVAACVSVIALAYAPFYVWNHNVLGFLHDFSTRFHYNESLFAWVGEGGAAALFAAAIVGAFYARRQGGELAQTMVLVILAYALLAPSVWPWYLTVFTALVPLMPRPFEGAMRPLVCGIVAWLVLAPLGYASQVLPVARVVEYAPVALGLALYLRNIVAQRLYAFEPAG